MKKKSVLFIITLFLCCSVLTLFSQSKFDKALLWKVSGNGLTQPSYVFGTHHLTDKNFIDSIDGFYDALESVEQVIGELVITPESTLEMQTKMQQASIMPENEGYKDILSEDDYKKLDNGLNNFFKQGLSGFGQLKPGMLSVLYSMMLYSMVDPGFNPATHEAIDVYIQRIAGEKGKPSLSLETVEDQLYALFDFEPLKDQAQSLICGLENVEWGKESLVKINIYYKEKRLAEIYDLAFNNDGDPCPISLGQQKALNEDRNNKWMEKLPTMIKDKSSFIAVGALHLAGEVGILNLLEKAGYTVEAVN